MIKLDMKKVFAKLFFLLFVIIACTNVILSQTIILEEGFEGGSLPTGWTVVDADGDGQNWIVPVVQLVIVVLIMLCLDLGVAILLPQIII